jgi:hypothetical protein
MQTAVTYNEDALRVVWEEVQNPPALLEVVLGVGAQAPDQVRELDAIPHKEHLHEATKVRAVSHTCIKPVAPEWVAHCWVYHASIRQKSNTNMLNELLSTTFLNSKSNSVQQWKHNAICARKRVRTGMLLPTKSQLPSLV